MVPDICASMREAIHGFCEEIVKQKKFGSSGPQVSVIGQGTWYIDQRQSQERGRRACAAASISA